jgi:hypothetical protein
MSGHTSQIALPRSPEPPARRGRRLLLSLLSGLAFFAVVFLTVHEFPDTAIGRSIHIHLGQLADPQSWTP